MIHGISNYLEAYCHVQFLASKTCALRTSARIVAKSGKAWSSGLPIKNGVQVVQRKVENP
jgi:hypothetical protein